MLFARALELGFTNTDLDNIDIGFIIECAEQRNNDVEEEDVVDATPEMLGKFFN